MRYFDSGLRFRGVSLAGLAAPGSRDYLSTYLKLATILALTLGILFVHPYLRWRL